MRHQTARVENEEVSDMDSQSSKGQRTKKNYTEKVQLYSFKCKCKMLKMEKWKKFNSKITKQHKTNSRIVNVAVIHFIYLVTV